MRINKRLARKEKQYQSDGQWLDLLLLSIVYWQALILQRFKPYMLIEKWTIKASSSVLKNQPYLSRKRFWVDCLF